MKKERKKESLLENYKMTWFFLKKVLPYFIVNSVLMIIVAILPAMVMYYQLKLFDSFESQLLEIGLAFVIYFIWKILSEICDFVYAGANKKFEQRIRYIYFLNLYQNINNLDINYFADSEFYNLLYRVKENGSESINYFIVNTQDLVKNLIRVVSLSLVLFKLNWVFPVMTLLFSIPYIILFRKLNFNHYFTILNNSPKTRKNHYMIDLLTKREYVKEKNVFRYFEYIYNLYSKINEELFLETYKLVKKYTVYSAIISISKRLIQILTYILGIYFISINKMSIGQFVVLFQSVKDVQSSLLQTVDTYVSNNRYAYNIQDIRKFLDMKNEMFGNDYIELEKFPIVFKNVSFKYPFSEEYAIRNLNVEIPYGQKVAIVGENGSGKSTFAYLVSGLYKPSEGRIEYGGTDIENILPAYRKKIGFVFQNFLKYKGTIRENIELGSGNIVSKEDASKAMHKSGLSRYTDALKNGVETELGFLKEESIDLSGGQWQKIAVSRGLVDDTKNILILDEAAAALDAFAESELYANFNKLSEGKTVITIAHRLGIAKTVDRIIVLHNGNIVEDGTHYELMKKKSFYYKMYDKQRMLYEV